MRRRKRMLATDGVGGAKVRGVQAGEECVCFWKVGVLTCTEATICSCSWPSLKKRHWQDGHFSKALLSSIAIRLQPSGEQPEWGVMMKHMIVHWLPYHICLCTFLKLPSSSLFFFFYLRPLRRIHQGTAKVFSLQGWLEILWIQVENPLVSVCCFSVSCWSMANTSTFFLSKNKKYLYYN